MRSTALKLRFPSGALVQLNDHGFVDVTAICWSPLRKSTVEGSPKLETCADSVIDCGTMSWEAEEDSATECNCISWKSAAANCAASPPEATANPAR